MKAWIKEHTPANTKRTYSTYAKQYVAFGKERSLDLRNPVTVAAFMKSALERPVPLARSTINKAIPSAVADMFRYEDCTPTQSPLVLATKKVVSRLTPASVPRIPVTKDLLVRMVHATVPKLSEMGVRDMFMMVLMFLGFLRESEAVQLRVQDVWLATMMGKEVLMIFIGPWAKADTERKGETVVLTSAKKSLLCPVAWYKTHLQYRNKRRPDEWPTHVFHTLDDNRAPLATSTPYHTIKRMLKMIKVDPKGYGSHSLRRGGATAAAKKIRTHVLKRHGRWKSDAVYLYIVDDEETMLSVTEAILH